MPTEIQPSYETLEKFFSVSQLLLENNVKYIFEFGSRYGEDSVQFAKQFPDAMVYSFECNPNTLVECRKATSQYRNIVLTEKAITKTDGNISFFAIDKDKTITTWHDGNQGASSLLQASGKYEVEQYVQNEINVDGISLKTFLANNEIPRIDLLWMDIQGAELMALQGLKDRIQDVRLIHLEVEFIEIYSQQPLFGEIKKFFEDKNFVFLGYTYKGHYSADAVFINKKDFDPAKKDQIEKVLIFTKSQEIQQTKNTLNIIQKLINKIKKKLTK